MPPITFVEEAVPNKSQRDMLFEWFATMGDPEQKSLYMVGRCDVSYRLFEILLMAVSWTPEFPTNVYFVSKAQKTLTAEFAKELLVIDVVKDVLDKKKGREFGEFLEVLRLIEEARQRVEQNGGYTADNQLAMTLWEFEEKSAAES